MSLGGHWVLASVAYWVVNEFLAIVFTEGLLATCQ